uniref:Uncharacterized protein n=1 Tax=Pararge aegeria TaxID=116150 RepID=S4PUU3_9NEOP
MAYWAHVFPVNRRAQVENFVGKITYKQVAWFWYLRCCVWHNIIRVIWFNLHFYISWFFLDRYFYIYILASRFIFDWYIMPACCVCICLCL